MTTETSISHPGFSLFRNPDSVYLMTKKSDGTPLGYWNEQAIPDAESFAISLIGQKNEVKLSVLRPKRTIVGVCDRCQNQLFFDHETMDLKSIEADVFPHICQVSEDIGKLPHVLQLEIPNVECK